MGFHQVIMNRIKESPEDAGEELPFEMRALEAFLLAVASQLARDAGFLEQDSKKVRRGLSIVDKTRCVTVFSCCCPVHGSLESGKGAD
jgi:hypothetical protein